ncbi:MAG TPA: cation transporter [Sulfurimonas sp. UBA12504]|nr:MAG: cation transporter [Sulfurimonas sp. GWF2_37_8]DAB30967.1 MAG TPA: cation transporter [Sulfurimonas sp. UBA12504]
MQYILFLALLLAFADAKEVSVQQLFSVKRVKVEQISDAKSIKAYGFVKEDESRIYEVTPRFGGFVERLYADKIYTKVKKGQALVKVYSPEVLKAKEEYRNTLNYTKIRQNDAMLESAKMRLELLDISYSEIQDAATSPLASRFTTLLSPIDGYIFKKTLNNKAAFNAKNKLFEIVNLDKVWVELKVHQDQLEFLSQATRFKLTTPSYKEVFEAKKSDLYPQLDQKEESFTLRLEVENKNHLLRPGMYMSVQIQSDIRGYLTLPTSAVIRKNAKYFVFGIGEYEGEYVPKNVEVEVLNAETYIIKSGVREGEEVVNNALFMMDSDAQINGLY